MATQEQIDEAKQAYHELITGKQIKVLVDQNGERIEYTPIRAAKLLEYIGRLEEEMSGQPKKPMGAFFW